VGGDQAGARVRLQVGAAVSAAVDFLFPATCVSCERLLDAGEMGLVCGRCWVRLAFLSSPGCERCGHPRRLGRCRWCALILPEVSLVRSVCWTHRGTGAAIVHALKYSGWHAAADGIAERIARVAWPYELARSRTALVPVPLSGSRLRERGYNQSEAIANGLARRWRLPVWLDVIERARSTETQTRLTPEERLANVSGAFRARESALGMLRNTHVVLVDDVVTTAATLNACAAALLAGGARTLSYVTFGRAPAPGDR
jgi:ComF family protein